MTKQETGTNRLFHLLKLNRAAYATVVVPVGCDSNGGLNIILLGRCELLFIIKYRAIIQRCLVLS